MKHPWVSEVQIPTRVYRLPGPSPQVKVPTELRTVPSKQHAVTTQAGPTNSHAATSKVDSLAHRGMASLRSMLRWTLGVALNRSNHNFSIHVLYRQHTLQVHHEYYMYLHH